ncbi:MAG TPA: putative phage tail protein [Acetobacteraceae bacterium]|nr:putative phage tail protein [Acetobacteraceae bacterium]
MPVLDLSAADIVGALQRLMPRGRIWRRDPDSVQSQVWGALAQTYVRLTARDNNLLVDAFPATTVELLPEWQATLGLPDPCAGPLPTIEQEQAQVVARLVGRGGASVPYFIQFAANLGYAITITLFKPFRFGDPFGTPLYGDAWAFAWQVNAPAFTVNYFQFGRSRMGEPFASWGNTALQCEMQRLAPAHTTVFFSYR